MSPLGYAAPQPVVGCTKNMLEPIDKNGTKISKGTWVRMPSAPDELLSGLPEDDQLAIRDIIGKELRVKGFDKNGHVELWFIDKKETYHYIWVRPSELEVVSKKSE